jgi:SAM-dependent methyltransferase
MRRDVVRSFSLASSDGPLELTVFAEKSGHVIDGVLTDARGDWYPVESGVPSFLRGALRPDQAAFAKAHGLAYAAPPVGLDTGSQGKTSATFSDKWRRFKNYGLEPAHQPFLQDWYIKKLGRTSVDDLRAFYRSKRTILEVGPGSGFNTRFMAEASPEARVFAADISDAALTTFENTSTLPNCHVVQADLMELPFQDGFFDFIIADGVLHHTPDTKKALFALFAKLRAGGQMFFYVYRKMGPARQFVDQYVRERFSKLDPEACYRECEAITELGRELSKLDAKIELTHAIPVLGIPAGTHDVQRLLYYNFIKCFWNDAFDFETNNMVNFDWYHPHDAWQHTDDEVNAWLDELRVRERAFHPANPNGISCLFTKP